MVRERRFKRVEILKISVNTRAAQRYCCIGTRLFDVIVNTQCENMIFQAI